VEQAPDNPLALYDDAYYSSVGDSRSAYQRYQYTAEHSVTWAASLIHLLRPAGRVLDIGSADGHLLKKLKHSHEGFGVEVNDRMAALCRAEGFPVLASDLLDPRLIEQYEGTFDIVSAIAVFEHILDFRQAVQIAMRLLRPDGILIFEVPVISGQHDSSEWFRSSLEHIHYPSETSLRFLFEEIGGHRLIGSEVAIHEFAPTYAGLVPKRPEDIDSLRNRFQGLTQTPARTLVQPEEKRFRWLFELVHAAQVSPDVLELLRDEDLRAFSPALRERLLDLWIAHARRTQSIAAYLTEVEQARDWHANQSQAYARESADHKEAYERTEQQARACARESADLKEQSAALQERSAALKEQYEQCLLALQRQASEIDLLRAKAEQFSQVVAAQERALCDMKTSWSWRLTSPLRALTSGLRPNRRGTM